MADLIAGMALATMMSRFIPALLVLVVMYGILGYSHALGDNKFVHALLSVCVAVLFLYSTKTTDMVAFIVPWFTVLFIFIIFILLAFKTMGVSDDIILKTMGEYKGITWWILILAIIIGLVSLSNVLGQGFLEKQPGYTPNTDGTYTSPSGEIVQSTGGSTTSSDFGSNLTNTIFHPTILGFLLVGFIASFSVYFMTRMPR